MMPKPRVLPPVDSDNSTLLGPFAFPFVIGYSLIKLGAEFSGAWADAMFAGRDHRSKDEPRLPVPDPLEDRDDPELFA